MLETKTTSHLSGYDVRRDVKGGLRALAVLAVLVFHIDKASFTQ